MDYYKPLLAGNIYHIVSRAVGSEKLFLNDDNYSFFLQRFNKYIAPVADTLAWALLPNHFHFLIQVKSYQELLVLYKKTKPHKEVNDGWQPDFIMQQFSNLLNSYAKSFNKRNNRKGALFMDYLRRVEVSTEGQFTATVFYIHKNPIHHGYCKKPADWYWSSFNSFFSEGPVKIQKEKVFDFFGNRERFIEFHSRHIYFKNGAPNL